MFKEPNFDCPTIWTGDNLQVMRCLNSDSVDLVYLDPPFNSKKDYNNPLSGELDFKDIWTLDDVGEMDHGDIADECPAAHWAIHSARFTQGKSAMAYLIYMAVRLIEIRRILRPTGSVYLHCDPTMGAYLKQLMDAVFGKRNFVNEIVWSYRTGGSSPRYFAQKHDTILFYGNGGRRVFNVQKEKSYDKGKRKPGVQNYGQADAEFFEDDDGRVYNLVNMRDVWDISYINSQAKERLGYSTQKPIDLLLRIVAASSNPGDVVFDPFCGCATALEAADRLERRWAGCDISPKGAEKLLERLSKAKREQGSQYRGTLPEQVIRFDVLDKTRTGRKIKRKDPLPTRTDGDGGEIRKDLATKRRMFGEQEGYCLGCWTQQEMKFMDFDRIVPGTKGGQYREGNVQLLCRPCNNAKGGRTMSEWLTDMKKNNSVLHGIYSERRREIQPQIKKRR